MALEEVPQFETQTETQELQPTEEPTQEASYDWFVTKAYQDSQNVLESQIEEISQGDALQSEKERQIEELRVQTAQSQAETITGKPNPTSKEVSSAIEKLPVTPNIPIGKEETQGDYLAHFQDKVIDREVAKFLELKNSSGDEAIKYLQDLLGSQRALTSEEIDLLNNGDIDQIKDFLEQNLTFDVLIRLAARTDSVRDRMLEIVEKIQGIEKNPLVELTSTGLGLAEISGELFIEGANMEAILNIIFDSHGMSAHKYRNSFLSSEHSFDQDKVGTQVETKMLNGLAKIFRDEKMAESFLKEFIWKEKDAPEDVFQNNAALNELKTMFSLGNPPEEQKILELKQKFLDAIKKSVPDQLQITSISEITLTDSVLDFLYAETYKLTQKSKKQETPKAE